MTKRPRVAPAQAEELSARIVKVRRRYFIHRSSDYEKPYIDDEAELELDAVIETVSRRHRKLVGEAMNVSLLSAKRYAPEDKFPTPFFGSVNLRGRQRSALAYLPSAPFWHVPGLIRDGSDLLELTFTPLKQGFGHLLPLHVTDQPTSVPD